MRAQIAAEFRKLLSTRTVWWLAVGVVAFSVTAVLSVSGQSDVEYANELNEQQFVFVATFVKLFFLVMGIRVVTDEYRFGTIVPTFVSGPVRTRVILSKAVVVAAAGALIALAGQVVMMGTAAAMFELHGHAFTFGSEGVRLVVSSVLAGSAWAVLGAGVGAVVRSQVVAIVGSFVWLMAIEEMIASRIGDLAAYLPGPSGYALALADGALFSGAAVLAAWALGTVAAGTVVTVRSDIT